MKFQSKYVQIQQIMYFKVSSEMSAIFFSPRCVKYSYFSVSTQHTKRLKFKNGNGVCKLSAILTRYIKTSLTEHEISYFIFLRKCMCPPMPDSTAQSILNWCKAATKEMPLKYIGATSQEVFFTLIYSPMIIRQIYWNIRSLTKLILFPRTPT